MAYVSTDRVAATGTPGNERLRALGMVPLGAAVWTSAGRLADDGIEAIVHAASGAMRQTGDGFDPTRGSITACIQNALALAEAHGHRRLALPFIAGGIFADRIEPAIDKAELAALIVQACETAPASVEPVLVAHADADRSLFEAALAHQRDTRTRLLQGSLTDFALHGARAIVNAANMEVVFGGGISGVIGKATGDPAAIEAEAAEAIAEFWAANPPPGVG